MRPLKLSLRAFGPFVGEEIVDFTLYGDNAFLLINGPTGAGKTTLLDGICYALYGEASGATRSEHYLRSQRAAKEVICQVEFLFRIGPRTYSIKRRPAQNILYKNAPRDLNHQVEFCEVDSDGQILGERLSKINEVRERIEALLGFSSEQFRQVVVLPQGEFRRLLLAKSDEKEKILEKLFNTGRYKFVEEALKKRRSLLAEEMKQIKAEVEGILSSCQVSSAAELEERIFEISRQRAAQAQALVNLLLQQQLCHEQLRSAQADAERFAEFDTAHRTFTALEEEREAMALQAAKVEAAARALILSELDGAVGRGEGEVAALHQRIAELGTASHALGRAVEEARKRLDLCRAEQGRIAAEVAEATRLGNLLTQLRELEELRTALAKAQQGAEAAQAECARLQVARIQDEAEIERLTLRIEELAVTDGRLGEIRGEIVRLTQLVKVRSDFDAESCRLQRLDSEIAQAAAQLQQAETAAVAVRGELDGLQKHFLAGQAAYLAVKLAVGESCPVCGSLDHPCLATAPATLPTESELEGATQRFDRALVMVESLKAVVATLAGEQQGAIAGRARLLDALEGHVDASPSSLQERLTALERERETIAASAALLNAAREERIARQARRQDCLQSESPAVAALVTATATVERLHALIANSEAACDGVELAAVSSRIAAIEAFIARVNREAQEAEEESSRTSAVAQKNQGELGQAREQLQRRMVALAELQDEYSCRLVAEGFADAAACRAARLEPAILARSKDELERYLHARAAAAERRQRAAEICTGRERPDLTALQSARTRIDQEVGSLQQEIGLLSGQEGALQRALANIGVKGGGLTRLEEAFAVVGRLADVAGGQNPQRMTLQRYVLAALFEEVAIAASRRLAKMSRGRYHLLRAEVPRDGKSTGGLDLDVIDDLCGERRPAFTLSGGESFLASLALALGLSDVVLAQSGGRYLDCIFIDEGFGTLDGETLDFALNTLIELHQSGRVIGIISHVAELKERIPSRIDIVASKEGSSIVQGV